MEQVSEFFSWVTIYVWSHSALLWWNWGTAAGEHKAGKPQTLGYTITFMLHLTTSPFWVCVCVYVRKGEKILF